MREIKTRKNVGGVLLDAETGQSSLIKLWAMSRRQTLCKDGNHMNIAYDEAPPI